MMGLYLESVDKDGLTMNGLIKVLFAAVLAMAATGALLGRIRA